MASGSRRHPFEAMKAAGHAKPSTTWDYTVTDAQREGEHVGLMLERLSGPASPDARAAAEKLMAEKVEGPIQ